MEEYVEEKPKKKTTRSTISTAALREHVEQYVNKAFQSEIKGFEDKLKNLSDKEVGEQVSEYIEREQDNVQREIIKYTEELIQNNMSSIQEKLDEMLKEYDKAVKVYRARLNALRFAAVIPCGKNVASTGPENDNMQRFILYFNELYAEAYLKGKSAVYIKKGKLKDFGVDNIYKSLMLDRVKVIFEEFGYKLLIDYDDSLKIYGW